MGLFVSVTNTGIGFYNNHIFVFGQILIEAKLNTSHLYLLKSLLYIKWLGKILYQYQQQLKLLVGVLKNLSKTYFTSSRYCIITQKQYCRLYSLNLSKTYFTCSRYCTKTQYRVLSVVLIEFVPRCNLSQVHFAKEKVFKDWNEATRKEMHSTNSFSLPLLPPSLPSSFLSVTKCPIHY